jgi:hypothetical protein
MDMRHNMGRTDRIIRAALLAPAAVVLAVLVGPGTVLGIVALVIAAVMLATAAAGFCPLYRVLGINTCPVATSRR